MAKAKNEDQRVAKEAGRSVLSDEVFIPELSLPHAFAVVANRISLTLQKMYSERFGLSVVGWRLMALLGTHSPLSAKALAELTAMDQVSISRALEQLVSKRLVSRRVDPADRRRVVLRLSKTGEDVYRQIVPVLQATEKALVAALSEEDAQKIRRIMRELLDRSAVVLPQDCDWQQILRDYGTRSAAANGKAETNRSPSEDSVPTESRQARVHRSGSAAEDQ